MAIVIASITCVTLLLVRERMQQQVTDGLTQDLRNSVETFHNLETERLEALRRENALLADLPTLKALLTSSDDLTIQDGAVEFWQLSGQDVFALADPSGRVIAAYAKNASAGAELRKGLEEILHQPRKPYVIDGRQLYACSRQPLYFGSEETGTLLGYVIIGISIDRSVHEISTASQAEAAFVSNGGIVASTLVEGLAPELIHQLSGGPQPTRVVLDHSRFLATSADLTSEATEPLRLIVLKSLAPAELSIARLDHMLLIAGLLALLLGTVLMASLSHFVTKPLEQLSLSVRAFGMGDRNHTVPQDGTEEVLELSAAFTAMRDEIQRTNNALVESERLATIGRMASSVSHDLRHYLAAIYANAEFLAGDTLSERERSDIFADIRSAVHGTTEMIESLLIFGRTGGRMRAAPELMASLLERAVSLVRAHPDGQGVQIRTLYADPTETAIVADAKQIERAIQNLLLNACQSPRAADVRPKIEAVLETTASHMVLSVIDNGVGVPEFVRATLFDPFVSEGKHKGTGLGLTLAHTIAVEHGGDVVLLSSQTGKTIFQLRVARDLRVELELGASHPAEAESKEVTG
jgi:signal transduction histidine kinase